MGSQTVEQKFASRLHGLQSGCEISKALINEACRCGVVIVRPDQDSGCRLCGAIYDDLPGWGNTSHVWREINFKTLRTGDGPARGDQFIKQVESSRPDCAWSFETNIPGAESFDICEGNSVNSQGLVFRIGSLAHVYPVRSALEIIKGLSAMSGSYDLDDAVEALQVIHENSVSALRSIQNSYRSKKQ